ncbi:kunitz trypsin inhibitor 5-like [Pistacia vera]|uniref:kunitz trypsin inhibitor 5-like n=1 Tax=Pistacia vera TaxID=55513 RepID=UPI001263A377|nr:kunitz trypsin inhibitor 5-like [Pistacia vera]
MNTSSLLSFLFLALIASTPLLGAADPDPLLDVNGEKLLTGAPYYIVSAIRGGGGGGLSLFPSKTLCPLDVIQQNLDTNRGQSLLFSPATQNEEEVLYESTDLNIKFSTPASICFQPTVWRVDNYDSSTGQWFITTNGVEGNPGAETLQNWFKFEMVGNTNSYKIVHCPKVCDSCVSLCSEVGLYEIDGVRRLAIKGERIFRIVFIKAEEFNSLHADGKSNCMEKYY